MSNSVWKNLATQKPTKDDAEHVGGSFGPVLIIVRRTGQPSYMGLETLLLMTDAHSREIWWCKPSELIASLPEPPLEINSPPWLKDVQLREVWVGPKDRPLRQYYVIATLREPLMGTAWTKMHGTRLAAVETWNRELATN
jgi:hypothetical protein